MFAPSKHRISTAARVAEAGWRIAIAAIAELPGRVHRIAATEHVVGLPPVLPPVMANGLYPPLLKLGKPMLPPPRLKLRSGTFTLGFVLKVPYVTPPGLPLWL